MQLRARSFLVRQLGACALLVSAACQSSGPDGSEDDGDGAESFVSHVPGQSRGDDDNAGGDGSDGSESPAEPGADDGGGDSPERAISEADIIRIEGDRLYALSRYAGLSIIDVANPAKLRMLGRHRVNATPFEMYLEAGVAYVMYNDFGSYEVDEATGSFRWNSASRMQALNVSDPKAVKVIGDYEVPGSISDSRKVGDVIYLVTYEDGYCWDCEPMPNTRIVSFDTKNPAKFERIDEVRFTGETESWGPRSVTVTSERMYVAGPTWEDKDSSIQVVDISDPAGDIKVGAEVPIHGSIESRWQMDEYEGVLRVISQPTPWRTDDPPHVQTFKVESAQEVTPLASLPVKLPRPEDLRSVRFDGPRAYAITFEQIDPLFTFDLTDPANPKQVGELEIPGFVYHMEPRGDRVYALGFDWDSESGGALHVSIFDTSVLAEPKMLSRVNFGGDWAHVAEDQDRIHKAFNIMLDEGLILVPFGGGDYDDATCHYEYQSGIQLIDVKDDSLQLRGVAPQVGEARRALLHKDHLIGVTDNAVQVFDINDRDKPVERAQLDVARNIQQLHVLGGSLMRFGSDWWTDRTMLDFTTLDNASTAEPTGELDFASVIETPENECNSWSYWEGQAFVHGNVAYVPRREQRYGSGYYRQRLVFYVVDLSDRSAPKLSGTFELEAEGQNEYLGGVVLTDSALLVGRGQGSYYYDARTGERSEPTYAYDIFDLSDPLAPTFQKRFEVPSRLAMGGWGWGAGDCGMDMGWGWWFSGSTGALVSGDLVISQHEESLDDGTGRVRYFLDRLDVSNPREPKLLEPVNIPGQVVHYDGKEKRLVTLDYDYREKAADDWEDCSWEGNSAWFDESIGKCRIYDRRIHALELHGDVARRVSTLSLDEDRVSTFVAVTSERVFYATRPRERDDSRAKGTLETLAYGADGRFQKLPSVELSQSGWWWSQIYARGKRAFVSESGALNVLDTSDLAKPTMTKHEMQGWGCSALEVHEDRAYCALGEYGVFTIDL